MNSDNKEILSWSSNEEYIKISSIVEWVSFSEYIPPLNEAVLVIVKSDEGIPHITMATFFLNEKGEFNASVYRSYEKKKINGVRDGNFYLWASFHKDLPENILKNHKEIREYIETQKENSYGEEKK